MEELPKQRSQEESSSDEENDRKEQVKEDTATSTTPKRSYECTFCKRGFTNAQALGGHMNIHRKDRAKNKQPPSGSSVSSNKAREESMMNPSYMAPISSETTTYYPIFRSTPTNYHMYFQQSAAAASNPRLQHGFYHGRGHHFLVPKPQSLNLNEEELWGANLSLQLGSTDLKNSDLQSGVSKEDELDLELRLGHDP